MQKIEIIDSYDLRQFQRIEQITKLYTSHMFEIQESHCHEPETNTQERIGN